MFPTYEKPSIQGVSTFTSYWINKMKFLSTKHQAYRLHRIYRLPGYIDTFDEYKQQFRLDYYAFWGLIKYRSKVLFEEVIPNYVIMHEWFFPWNADWSSACPEEIRDFYHWRGQPYADKKNVQEVQNKSTEGI